LLRFLSGSFLLRAAQARGARLHGGQQVRATVSSSILACDGKLAGLATYTCRIWYWLQAFSDFRFFFGFPDSGLMIS
jgi:hypothetical protein